MMNQCRRLLLLLLLLLRDGQTLETIKQH